jgi:hypothetical protein
MPRRIMIALLVLALGPIAHAMSCLPVTVDEAFEKAEVVFRGKIVDVHDAQRDAITDVLQPRKRIAVFQVRRVWKGSVGTKFEMPVVELKAAPAGYDQFWSNFLIVGNDLLVYAVRVKESGEYTTSQCWRTGVAKKSKDFRELGPGWEPGVSTQPSATKQSNSY